LLDCFFCCSLCSHLPHFSSSFPSLFSLYCLSSLTFNFLLPNIYNHSNILPEPAHTDFTRPTRMTYR
ncbi:hypothetical protein BDQ12DRAFT_694101, partial [Crucibulum laeve]